MPGQENRDGTEVSAGQVSAPVRGKTGGALNQYWKTTGGHDPFRL